MLQRYTWYMYKHFGILNRPPSPPSQPQQQVPPSPASVHVHWRRSSTYLPSCVNITRGNDGYITESHTPEQTDDADKHEPQVGWHERKVDDLSREEDSPVAEEGGNVGLNRGWATKERGKGGNVK